ncbi:MAG: ComEC/Rec2 family competence protein [SAR324 cluster bacterium]|nr:ComEC/Rec2 family competence protein [SAR324 cluster bacterium]
MRYKTYFSPLVFLSLFLGLQCLYLKDTPNWYLWLTASEFLLILVGVVFKSTRFFAVLFLAYFAFQSLPWLVPTAELSESCLKAPSSITGFTKRANFQRFNQLDLIQVTLKCGGDEYKFASARLVTKGDFGVRGRFLGGDKIKVKNFKITSQSAYHISGELSAFSQSYNQSWQAAFLKKSPLFYYLKNKANFYLSPEAAGLFTALTLADRGGLDKELKKTIGILGVSHLFAISGMHIGVVYLWISFVFRKFALFFKKSTERGRLILLKDAIALVLIYFYIQLIGEPISAIRSFEMLFFWVVIRHFLPWQPLWSILLTIACLMLIGAPLLISRLGFQLSFLSVFAIFLILPLLPSGAQNPWKNMARRLQAAFAISTWLFFFNLGLVLKVFGEISWVSIPSNLFHILFMSFVFLPFALLVLVFNIFGFLVGGLSGVGSFVGMGSAEFYLFSFLNGLAKFWAASLKMNGAWAQNWMVNIKVDWGIWGLAGYWVFLSLAATGVVYLQRQGFLKLRHFKLGKGL